MSTEAQPPTSHNPQSTPPPQSLSNSQTNSSNTTTTTTTTTTNTPPQSILPTLHAYPFASDSGFLTGLSQILGHPGTPPTPSELSQTSDLVLSAKCFYYSRKFQISPPIDPATYKTWLATHAEHSASSRLESQPITASTTTPTTTETAATAASLPTVNGESSVTTSRIVDGGAAQPTASASPAEPQPQPPPYPTSFAAIVDLITNNKPIPGIEEIPTTVLEPGSSKQDKATRRRKPWEKDEDTGEEAAVAGVDDLDLGRQSVVDESIVESAQGEGLLRLLRPDAVPDSGLVAKE